MRIKTAFLITSIATVFGASDDHISVDRNQSRTVTHSIMGSAGLREVIVTLTATTSTAGREAGGESQGTLLLVYDPVSGLEWHTYAGRSPKSGREDKPIGYLEQNRFVVTDSEIVCIGTSARGIWIRRSSDHAVNHEAARTQAIELLQRNGRSETIRRGAKGLT